MANSSGNLGFQMTPPPAPNVGVQAQPYTQQPEQVQMPQQYYGGKTGSVAFMADKILTGFLAGTKARQQQQANKVAQEIGSAKTGLDIIGQAYNAAVQSGDQKKIDQASKALSEAYNDYLNKAEKYALPDKQVDPKTGKPKKQKAGAQGNPNAPIAESTIQIMRQTDPKLLYGPSKQEQQQSEQLDMQTKAMKQAQADEDRWAVVSQKDPSQLTPQEKRFQEFYEYKKFGRTPAQQKEDAIKDQLLGKIMGGKPLNDQDQSLAESLGLVKPKVTNTVTRTVRGKDGGPQTQLVSIGPDGKVVGTQVLEGKDYVPPDQAEVATKVFNAELSAKAKWYKKAHPELPADKADQIANQWALSTVSSSAAGDYSDRNQQLDTMNRALQTVLGKHQKEYKGGDGQMVKEPDELYTAMMGNVVSLSDESGGGRYVYMPQLAAGQKEGGSSWYKPWTWGDQGTEKWSGMTRAQLNGQEAQFQAELRAELKKQNPKMTDAQIDRMVPSMLTSQSGAAAKQMQPPPQQGGSPQAMQPPPGAQKAYSITLPDGTKATRQMSPEYADALAARGVKVEPLGQ